MRWFRIRKAKELSPALRQIFEQYGVATMQSILATTNYLRLQNGRAVNADDLRPDLLPWLTEQYDRAERKETWLITMEAAITILVALEAGPILYKIVYWTAVKLR